MTYTPPVLRRLTGPALRSRREARGYGLADAARILDCHPSTISRIETGLRGISTRDLPRMLAEYGPALDTLFLAAPVAHKTRGTGGTGAMPGRTTSTMVGSHGRRPARHK